MFSTGLRLAMPVIGLLLLIDVALALIGTDAAATAIVVAGVSDQDAGRTIHVDDPGAGPGALISNRVGTNVAALWEALRR